MSLCFNKIYPRELFFINALNYKRRRNDISHWFDPKTKDPKTCNLPGKNLLSYHTPNGLYPNIPPPFPDSEWKYDFDILWQKNYNYKVERLTKKVKKN